MDRLSSMPVEVNELILSKLDVPDVTCMKLVSTDFRKLVSSPLFSENYNKLRGSVISDWSVSHVLNDIDHVAGFLLWVRGDDGREIRIPLMPLVQTYIPDYHDDVRLTLVCVWGSVALLRLYVPADIEISREEDVTLLAVNPFNRRVREIGHVDLGFDNWRHIEMCGEDDTGTNYIVAYVEWGGLHQRYWELSSARNIWEVPIQVVRMSDEDFLQRNMGDYKYLIFEAGALTILVLFIETWPVFVDDETMNLVIGGPVVYNPEPLGGGEYHLYVDSSRATDGLLIEMHSHVLMEGGLLVSNIDQITLLGVDIRDHSYEYVFVAMVDHALLPDYQIVLDYSTLECVNEKAKYSMVVTEAVVEGEPYRGHGRHILVYTYDFSSGVWTSSRVSLEDGAIVQGGPFHTSRLLL